MRTILRANYLTCSQTMIDKLGLLTLSNNQHCPSQRHKLYMTLRSEYRGRIFRDRREIHLPKVKATIGQFTFKFTGAKDQLRVDGLTLGSFKRKTFKYLQEQDKTQNKRRL